MRFLWGGMFWKLLLFSVLRSIWSGIFEVHDFIDFCTTNLKVPKHLQCMPLMMMDLPLKRSTKAAFVRISLVVSASRSMRSSIFEVHDFIDFWTTYLKVHSASKHLAFPVYRRRLRKRSMMKNPADTNYQRKPS